MAAACLASFVILAGGLAALYGLDWYKNRRQNRKLARKGEVEDYNNAKEPLAEQLA
jgi:hypothetical protein